MKPRVFWAPVDDTPWCVEWHGTLGFFRSWRAALDHALRIAR